MWKELYDEVIPKEIAAIKAVIMNDRDVIGINSNPWLVRLFHEGVGILYTDMAQVQLF